jgi:predicted enzyme related to lactoylglutathione lyase
MSKTKKATPANIVWFEIPADDIARAKKFYNSLFGWKINPLLGSPVPGYQHIDTSGPDASPDGGLMKRTHPGHALTNYILVPSVTRFMAKVEKLGGRICKPKTPVPGMGYFALCQDTESNAFALWEMNPKAK